MAKNSPAPPVSQGEGQKRRESQCGAERKANIWAKRRRRIVLFLAVAATICAAALAARVLSYRYDITKSRRELAELQELAGLREPAESREPTGSQELTESGQPAGLRELTESQELTGSQESSDPQEPFEPRQSAYDADMRRINPDYVGVIKIEGTNIGSPVVRGEDNEKYLNTTFRGDRNIAGTIFMDYRCVGEYVPHILIYGHRIYDDGDNWLMFGGLGEFLDEEYLAEHPTILYMENDRVSEFEIFSARATDINDPAFYLDFSAPGSFAAFAARNGAPADAERIITLTTCIGVNNDRRMIVQGVLRGVYPAEVEYDENGLRIGIQRSS